MRLYGIRELASATSESRASRFPHDSFNKIKVVPQLSLLITFVPLILTCSFLTNFPGLCLGHSLCPKVPNVWIQPVCFFPCLAWTNISLAETLLVLLCIPQVFSSKNYQSSGTILLSWTYSQWSLWEGFRKNVIFKKFLNCFNIGKRFLLASPRLQTSHCRASCLAMTTTCSTLFTLLNCCFFLKIWEKE